MDDQVMRIVVRGRPSADMLAALPGFTTEPDRRGRTALVGPVRDQSQLFGILELLDRFHVPVVSVNPVEPADGFSPGRGDAAAQGRA